MEHVYIVSGLDCAICANNLERKINKLDGVTSCSINFMTKKMFLEYNDDSNFEKITEICKKFEDGITLKKIK